MSESLPDRDDVMARAEALRRAGRHDEATASLEALLAHAPDDAVVKFRLGQVAANRGDLGACRDWLEQAAAAAPGEAEYALRLGNMLERLGETQHAVQAYRNVLRLDPRHVPALIRVAELSLAGGEREAAVDACQRIVMIQGPVAPALRDPRLPPAMRQTLERIQSTLREKYQALRALTRDYVAARYEASELQRFHAALDGLGGQPQTSHVLHRPEFFYYPGLQDRPWFDTAQFDWAARVEAGWEAVRDEFAGLDRGDDAFQPYIFQGKADRTLQGTDFSSLAGNRDWSAFHLNKAGWIGRHCDLCPVTAGLMRELPLATAKNYMPEVFFSVLAPGTEIIPHYGQTNIRLTVHLGLVVPDGCGIRVGQETRHWGQGRLMAFDDSFEHAAWNRGDSDRVVLIFEAWHPELSAAEIDGLQHFFRTRADWLARFEDVAPPGGAHA